MYICICNAVTDKDIVLAISNGATSIKDLNQQLKVGTCCGSCVPCAKKIIKKHKNPAYKAFSIPTLDPAIV